MEEEDFSKLSIEDACVHKVWKARLSGYEGAKKLFESIDDEKSPEWNKYVGLMKKFVVDSHVMCQERGLEAVLVFVENSAFAGRTCGDVVSNIIQKALSAQKARIKELGAQVILMYIELEKQDLVLEELLKGTDSKNPKVTAACLHVINQALKEFGPKVVNVNKIMKKIPPLIETRDPTVRLETKMVFVEIHHWLGAAVKPQLSACLKPVQLADVEAEYDKVKDTTPRPTRFLKSEQAKKAAVSATDDTDAGAGASGDGVVVEEADPYDLLDPVDILNNLPKDFYTKLESKKWSERKEPLEELEKLLQTAPKLEAGDYGDLLRALKKVVTKDSNVVCVGFATKCVAGIAKGLKKKFHPYAGAMMGALFDKFKEKKQNVVTALREAVDAVFLSTNLEAIQEDALAALESKNPSIKAEVCSFLARCFAKSTPTILNKKLLKAYCKSLTTRLTEPDPTVRDCAGCALGTAMKVVGEKAFAPYLVDVDAISLKKVKDYYDKAEVVAVKQAPAKTAPAPVRNDPEGTESAASKPKVVRPLKAAARTTQAGQPPAVLKDSDAKAMSKKLIPREVYEDLMSGDAVRQSNACDQLTEVVSSIPVDDKAGQLLLSLMSVIDFSIADSDLESKLNLLKTIVDKYPLPREKVEQLFFAVSNHLTDPTYSGLVNEILTALAKKTALSSVAKAILPETEEDTNLYAAKLSWICSCMKTVDLLYEPDFLTGLGKKACENPNPTVSNAGVQLIGSVHIKLDSQPQQQPAPLAASASSAALPKSTSSSALPEKAAVPSAAEKIAEPKSSAEKVDISPKLNEALLSELTDKNWKVRLEAIEKVKNLITSAGSITANLGDAPPLIAARISDSNGKISANAIALVELLAPAIGPTSKKHINVFLPALMKAVGDQKTWIRSAVINCFNVWGDICGYDKFFEGEMIADALKTGSPAVRAELWSWLALKLPNIPPKAFPKDELTACLSTLFSNLEDRNADVRKNASEATLGVMIHLGYNSMNQALENIKGSGASAKVIKDILDKTRGSMPVQPLQKSKSGSLDKPGSGRASLAKAAPGSSATITLKRPRSTVSVNRMSTRPAKKEDEDDQSPLLQVNSLKTQRVIDEQKLKVLKWTFTSVRPEFIELLRDQMVTANVNKTLLGYMFHPDFRFHLRAIESLNEDLTDNRAGLKSNLDLILRWMTLKFYDTNPSVLLKGLEYLSLVFAILIEDEYTMLDSEAAAFIPSLLIKAGDPKDAVRNSVRLILKQIASVYPASKQFSYLMEGLKSKNSRQRSECLDQLCWLVETFGSTAFHPSMPAALKEIAKQIADRDNAVRNSALNCVVQAYYIEGERVFRMVGQISDKDMTLLEERIKRASKNRYNTGAAGGGAGVNIVKPLNMTETQQVGLGTGGGGGEPEGGMELSAAAPRRQSVQEAESSPSPEPPPTPSPEYRTAPITSTPNPSLTRPSSGAFSLPDVASSSTAGRFNVPKLYDIDLQFLDSSQEALFKPMNLTRITPTVSTFSQPNAIKRELANIATGDIDKSISAISKIETIILSDKRDSFIPHVDNFVFQLSHLMTILSQSAHPEVVNCYNTTFAVATKVCSMKEFCSQISESTLHKIIGQFLLLLTEPRLDTNQNMFGRAVNNIVVLFLNNSNKTNLMLALLKILYNSVNNPNVTNHFKELVVKCLWKLNKSHSEWDAELDYSRILTELYKFLKDYPTSWWKGEQYDFPLRTVKTILHTMVKSRGTQVREIADRMPNIPKDSELYIYIKRVIKHLKLDDPAKTESGGKEGAGAGGKENTMPPLREPLAALPPLRLTKEEQDELSGIFRMIGDFEETERGMKRLYVYLKNHPEANVEPFLSKTNPQFQNYIKKGLQALEEKQPEMQDLIRNSNANEAPPSQGNRPVNESEFTEEAGVVWNRLKNMQEISGCQLDNREESERHQTITETPTPDVRRPDLASLRAEFEKIKSGHTHK